MSHHGGSHNGYPNVNNHVPEPEQVFDRPFHLYEALPFTPFAAILPFDSSSASPAPSLTDIVSAQDFDALNREAGKQGAISTRVQQSCAQVLQLLQQASTKEFNFKTGPRATSAGNASTSLTSGLSLFTKLVLDQTSIPFRYPTPETPLEPPFSMIQDASSDVHLVPPPRTAPTQEAAVVQRPTPLKRSYSEMSRQAHAEDAARFDVLLPTRSELHLAKCASQGHAQASPQPALASPQPVEPIEDSIVVLPAEKASYPHPVTIAVELPGATSFKRTEYLVVPGEPISLSRKRKHDGDDGGDGDELFAGVDLQQRAIAASNELRHFYRQVSAAAEEAANKNAAHELVTCTTDGTVTMTTASQSKMHTLVAKAIKLNGFASIPAIELIHLLRLSEGALKHAESMEIRIKASWTDEEARDWVQGLPELELGIKAARTVLRIMCGDRKEKGLFSKDLIQKALDLFKQTVEGVIKPIAELRETGESARLFRSLSSHKKRIISVFQDCQKLFSLMASLMSKINLEEVMTGSLEMVAQELIFLETAPTEKSSVIDTQKFDGLRLAAMDVVSQIYLLEPKQRDDIMNSIVSSLAKLPLGKRARTFKLVNGTSIQPVSALIMRLVQTSAGRVNRPRRGDVIPVLTSEEDHDEVPASAIGQGMTFSIQYEDDATVQHEVAVDGLRSVANPLVSAAWRDASSVMQNIVKRALNSSKSDRDSPHRNLLDLFVEDFASCLDNPDWPAAELLLRILMMLMVQRMEDAKTTTTAKNMALEKLGIMGASISKLRGHVRKTASLLDSKDAGELSIFLAELAKASLERKCRPEQMLVWTGPYRATVEHLLRRSSSDPHLASAVSFLTSQWGSKVCEAYRSSPDSERNLGRLAFRLRHLIVDRNWLSNEFSFKDVSQRESGLAYATLVLNLPLCENYSRILRILMDSIGSDQPTVRSKSLKSINQVLETDPSILDENAGVVTLILDCSCDSSTQVRDSALGLIGKCIEMRPTLEEMVLGTVIARFIDQGAGVRKRAMKLAKDIYLRNRRRNVRASIAQGLLSRTQDPEESVRTLALQMIEDIWFSPFQNLEASAATQTSFTDHLVLLLHTTRQGNVGPILTRVLQSILDPKSRTAKLSREVCSRLVASMFDMTNNTESEDASLPSGRDALQALGFFANADPSLFTFEQLRLLKPYIKTIQASDEAVSRAVVVIFCRVLPELSSVHEEFLVEIRDALAPRIQKPISIRLLDDIMRCLWTISTLLKSSIWLARLLLSLLKKVEEVRCASVKGALNDQQSRAFERLARIVGLTGKYCDLDSDQEFLKQSMPAWKGGSVSGLMIDSMVPFAQSTRHKEVVRTAAIDAIGWVCQSWPQHYVEPKVCSIFQHVFDSQLPRLESCVLRSFKDFFAGAETKSEKTRDLTKIGGTNYDAVACATTARFESQIIRIASSSQDEHALLAVEVLASISRQGLTHPGSLAVTFIVLETSSNPRISDLAFNEHRALHGKHETTIEREYVKAFRNIFEYQKHVVGNTHGATAVTFRPKLSLLLEVLKISKPKNRQRFFSKLCAQIDFDIARLDMREEIPTHVQYARFVIENIAFVDFQAVRELQGVISALEKIFATAGPNVAQVIESEVLQLRVDLLDGVPKTEDLLQADAKGIGSELMIDSSRLRQMTAGAMILLAVWELRTHLRRLWGIANGRKDNKKEKGKDLSAKPNKVPNVSGDKFWEDMDRLMTALDSRERMKQTCRDFVDLMNVDNEFLLENEDEDTNEDGPATPSVDEGEDEAPDSVASGRKRKASDTPSRKKKQSRSNSQPRKRGRPRKQPTEDQDEVE